MSLLTLANELIERILLSLDAPSILACRLVDKKLDSIIRLSTDVQYLLACGAAGMVDNPRCNLPLSERLEALRKREEAWKNLRPVFVKEIEVEDELTCSDYDFPLSGGNLLCASEDLSSVHCLTLPSSPNEDPKWTVIPSVGPKGGNGQVVSSSLSLENDLIVNVVSTYAGNADRYFSDSLDLVLLQFSTGKYHPLADRSRIHLRMCANDPSVNVAVAGDTIALVIKGHQRAAQDVDDLFILDWKWGVQRLHHQVSEGSYSSLWFVSHDVLLVPNMDSSQFEVWRIPSLSTFPNAPFQHLSLQLPRFSIGYHSSFISCNGQPVACLPSSGQRPFHSSPEDSVIFFNFSFPKDSSLQLMLVVQRRGLLDIIGAFGSPSVSKDVIEVPWSDWGPAISRWFIMNHIRGQQSSPSSGNHSVLFGTQVINGMISIARSNPPYSSRNKKVGMIDKPDASNDEAGGWDVLDDQGIFAEEVHMGLQYAIRHWPKRMDKGVEWMADEERLVGVSYDYMGRIYRITVFYLG